MVTGVDDEALEADRTVVSVVTIGGYAVIFFFFSSRRRHTRLQGDWSSDVCSSDLSSERLNRSLHHPPPSTFRRNTMSNAAPAHKRILLKLSGEALMGDDSFGINRATIERMVSDRKSTRLNSSHLVISYAVFCLKKKHSG